MIGVKSFFASKTVLVNLAIVILGILILAAVIPLDRQIIGIALIVFGLLGAEFRRRATARITGAVNSGIDRVRR